MTAGTLPRRLVVGGLSAALLAAGLGIPLLAQSAAAAGCPAWTDPAGDSSTAQLPNPTGLIGDDNLDLVAAAFTSTPTTLTATFKVTKLTDTASDLGDEFHLNFTAGGKDLQIYSDRDGTGGFADEAGFYDFTDSKGAGGKAKATYDLASNTVTVTGALADLATLAGVPLAGKPVSAVSAETQDYLVPAQNGLPYDDAPTTQTLVLGTDCSGATPAAGETGTPAPSGSASPTPTASTTPTASPSPTASGPAVTNGLFDQPRKGCVEYKDATSDADPTGTGLDNEPALDVTQVNLKSPSGALQVYVGLSDPSAGMFPLWDGPVWSTSFTVGGKKVTLTATDTGPATATVGTAENKDIKATAKLDSKAKNIVFTVPLAGLSKAVGTTVTRGTAITGTAVETAADSLLGPQTADDAAGTKPEEKAYAYGDNSCFVPPPGIFAIDADRSGQFGDRTLVFATLNDADGTPVPGVNVTALISGGRAVTAKTDTDGIADLLIPLTMAAGSKTLYLTYAGDLDVGRTRATKPFTVVAERTLLRVAALRGGAQATVVDDDRPAHAVVGRYVRFTVGSKSYLRKTNSRGVAVLTGVRKGTAVKVTFLPVRGLYLGSKTVTVTAR